MFFTELGNDLESRKSSPFGDSIVDVVCASPQKEMGGVDAFPVIARVADKKTIGDRANIYLVRDSMSRQSFPTCRAFSDLSVTFCIQGSGPFPALIGSPFINLSPKTFFQSSVCISKIAHTCNDYHISKMKQGLFTEKEGC